MAVIVREKNPWWLRTSEGRQLTLDWVLLIGSIAIGAAISSADQWRPAGAVVAFLALDLVAEVIKLETRTARISTASTVVVVIMAVFGPAPAVLAGCLSMLADRVVHRTRPRWLLANLAAFATLGLVGGVWFELAATWMGPEPSDLLVAAVVAASFLPLSAFNFLMVAAPIPPSPGWVRRAFSVTFRPFIPWQLTSAVIASGAVLAYGKLGLWAAAVLGGVLALTAPLLRTVVVGLQREDAVSELRAVSDERAAEVARLASDRARLLEEVLHVAEHERGRLAETLHDGPLQRLLAFRQDLAERGEPWPGAAVDLDAAVTETRAVVAAFHPLTSTELGFEATVRAAAAPFLRGRVALEIDVSASRERLSDPLLCSVARELVTNAVKHARPSVVRVAVTGGEESLSLDVIDDGRGIDSSLTGSAIQAGHVGLAVARRRVEDAGGALEIRTVSAGGTHVRVTVPI